MKIVFIGPAISIHIQKWVDAFKDRHEVYLITMHPVLNNNWLFHNTFVLKFCGILGYYLNALEVHSIIKKINPDIVTVHYASGYGTLARLSKIGKYLLSVWGSDVFDFPYESKLKMKIIKKNLMSAVQILSTSKVMKEQVNKLVSPVREVIVTPFGVDTSVFFPKTEEKSLSGCITIGTVKTLSPKYGIDVLIRAYNEVFIKGLTNSRLLIVGGGPQEEELKKLAGALPSSNNIVFIGRINHCEVPEYLKQLDIYVALSERESFGVAIVEAQSSGLPVVVSDVGGLPEVVKHEETGFVVPQGDYIAAAEKILMLSNNRELRIQMGMAAREFVCKTYAWDKCIDIMEYTFFNFLKNK